MKQAIIGISAFYHDSAACLLVDGVVVAAAQEERFTRKKQDASFPVHSLRYCLDEGLDDQTRITAVAFYEKPYLKFERLLETYHAFAPKGLGSFLMAMPVWIKEKIFIKDQIKKALGDLGVKDVPIVFPEHHLSHAASAFYPSPFQDAAILTIDGVGEWATTTIGIGKGNTIEVIKQLDFPHSLGLFYSAFTYYCGFKVNSGEYKLMGLAPYGNQAEAQTRRFEKLILQELIDIREDGSFLLNMKYFAYPTGLRMTYDDRWKNLFSIARREEHDTITQPYMNLALAAQRVIEKIIQQLANTAKQLTGCDNLVMAGGVALNCVSNAKLATGNLFEKIWIQPAGGDAGGAIGAALAAWHIGEKKNRVPRINDAMKGSFLGPEFNEYEIEKFLRKSLAVKEPENDFESVTQRTARLLSEGNVIGWFQGRMEFGPRALGNRSILADARNSEMQQRLNLKIKNREGFRPFAPAVLEEDASYFFKDSFSSPYMLFTMQFQDDLIYALPKDVDEYDLMKKLYTQRSSFPAVTHFDYSARTQTVSKEGNPRFWSLLNKFKELTGAGILANTSFNVRGEPIVCTLEDAYSCFMSTDMDYLVLGNVLLNKVKQPKPLEKFLQKRFELD